MNKLREFFSKEDVRDELYRRFLGQAFVVARDTSTLYQSVQQCMQAHLLCAASRIWPLLCHSSIRNCVPSQFPPLPLFAPRSLPSALLSSVVPRHIHRHFLLPYPSFSHTSRQKITPPCPFLLYAPHCHVNPSPNSPPSCIPPNPFHGLPIYLPHSTRFFAISTPQSYRYALARRPCAVARRASFLLVYVAEWKFWIMQLKYVCCVHKLCWLVLSDSFTGTTRNIHVFWMIPHHTILKDSRNVLLGSVIYISVGRLFA